MDKKKLTNSEVRAKLLQFDDLERAFYWLIEIGKLKANFVRILSKSVLMRQGIDLTDKDIHHVKPLRYGITIDSVLNPKNLRVVTKEEHKVIESKLKSSLQNTFCNNPLHEGLRRNKKVMDFLKKKYRKIKNSDYSEDKLLKVKAQAFDDTVKKLGKKYRDKGVD